MNPEELKQKIALYYSKLPPRAQDMFASMGWLETLKKTSSKYGLNDQQIETLGTETTLVLLGIIPVAEYEHNISKEIGLRGENLENLLMEINGLVLNPIRMELGKAYEANSAVEEPSQPQPQVQPAKIPEALLEQPGYALALLEISRKHSLSVTQMGVIENLVKGVMSGIVDVRSFEYALEKSAWLTRDKAHEVTLDINEKVFKSIRKEMMGATEDTKDGAQRVLKSAGIELMSQKPKVEFQTPVIKNDREEMLKKIENPPIRSREPSQGGSASNGTDVPKSEIHEQKLLGSFSLPKKETIYEEKKDPEKSSGDPYREAI